ncbi:Lipoprotein (plasmid) [Sodalis praecaptivus]|uniref:Lipoprotein n=1 Tax=Sodalis praecaptivus TaxID=1239307 RepID=W0I462_9GAMM|nr:hypothetical protein [Sodalis praecaptivus]AHF79255.1 Lipoprotein [Sodalis praecaptivus]
MRKDLLIVISLFQLSGCTSQWIMNRPTAEDFSSARYACEAQSESKFPVKNEVAQRTVYSQHYEKCKKKEDCDGKKYTTIERPETESYVMDVNKDSRNSEFYRCMRQKGWEKEIKWL